MISIIIFWFDPLQDTIAFPM
uniref:Uncharacterized protein n=1 Tax=Arundo donax TaxID=35708 RepID=A0A0A8Z9Z5_ARUDO